MSLSRFKILHAIAIVSVAILAPSAAVADSLTGRAVDPQGTAVAEAKIKLFDRNNGQQRTTVSAPDGGYSFEGIPAGNYILEADASNSALIASEDVSVSGDQKLDISLRVAGVQTEISVTAATTPLSMMEVAKAMDIVDSEQMSLRGVFQISEALRALPGLQIQTLEGPGSFTKIRTRGLRTADTALLVDGMRFRDAGSPQNDPSGFIEDMTTVDTERIEFVRGSGSSLYGSNAMAGVINIESRSAGGPTHGEFRVEGGGLGMIRSVAGIGGSLGGSRFGYSGSFSHLNVTQGVRKISPYRNSSLQGTVNMQLTPSITVTGRFWGNQAHLTSVQSPTFDAATLANSPATGFVKAIPLPTDQLELYEKRLPYTAGNATYIPNSPDPDGRRHSSFYTDAFTFQQVVSPNTTYRIGYAGVDTRRGYINGPAGSGTFQPATFATSHFNGRTDTVQARLDQRIGAYNSFTGGYEFEREQYYSYNDTPVDSTKTSLVQTEQYTHAIYGQDQIRLVGGQLQLTLSGRAQTYSLQKPIFGASTTANPYQNSIDTIETPKAFTGDGAIAYFFRGTQTKLRAHGGNSFRAPSSYERFGGNSTGTSFSGDPRLSPERAIAIDGGIDQWLFDQKVQMGTTIFYTKLRETISSRTLPVGDPFGRTRGYINGGGGIARGVELSAHVSPVRTTTISATYTYTNSDSATATVAPDYFKILDLSPHTYTFSLTQWVGGNFHANFDFFGRNDYVTTLFGGGSRLFVFDGDSKANVAFGYQIRPSDTRMIELYGKVENVFNQKQYQDGYIGPKAWATGGLRMKF